MEENKQAAKQFAQGKKSTVLKYRVEADPLDEEQMLHVIILEDGRKYKMTDAELQSAIKDIKPAKDVVIDTSDGVDDQEASFAGKALAKAKGNKARAKAKGEEAEAEQQ